MVQLISILFSTLFESMKPSQKNKNIEKNKYLYEKTHTLNYIRC